MYVVVGESLEVIVVADKKDDIIRIIRVRCYNKVSEPGEAHEARF